MSDYDEADACEPSDSTRRTFCTELMLSSAALLLASSNLTKAAVTQDSVAYPPRRIEGAETLLPGSCLYFNYPTRNDPAVLVRTSDGEYSAYSRRCSHAGCSVDFDPSNRSLKCPATEGHTMPAWATWCLAHRGGRSIQSFYKCAPAGSFGPPGKALAERVR